jgi:hypothetical protein
MYHYQQNQSDTENSRRLQSGAYSQASVRRLFTGCVLIPCLAQSNTPAEGRKYRTFPKCYDPGEVQTNLDPAFEGRPSKS